MLAFRLTRGLRRGFAAAAPVLIALLGTVFATAPARAELTICNETAKPLSIAIGYKSGEDWVSEGWWNVAEGACRAVIDGDLQNRHYYYRDFNDRIAGEGYYFCTTRDEFTITGDADCAARGFDRSDFAHLDTGSKATSFTLTITGPSAPVTDRDLPMTEPAAPPPSAGLPPVGTYGEPFSVTGTLQGCDRIDGLLTCQFDVEGWLYVAYDDNRNLIETLDFIDSLTPGTEVALSGDMVSFGDVSADVVIREIEILDSAPATSGGALDWQDFAAADTALQGYWQSLDDPESMIAFFTPSDMEDYYGGELLSSSDYFVTDACPDAAPTGTLHLVATDREYGDTYCYEILTLEDFRLELTYLPRGNILSYGPADF